MRDEARNGPGVGEQQIAMSRRERAQVGERVGGLGHRRHAAEDAVEERLDEFLLAGDVSVEAHRG